MHEYSIVLALLDKVDAEAKAHGAGMVHRIRLQLGELAGVEAKLLESAYELARHRTICDQAVLEIVPVPAQWTCPMCGGSIPRGEVLRCLLCDQPAKLASGDEIILERIEMEAA